MNSKLIAVGLMLIAFSPLPVLAQSEPVSVESLLRQETDISQLPNLRDWQTNLQSSYDRTGGNSDANNYLSVDGNTATLADMNGPGAIVRIWSADPAGEIKIYVDDNPTPVIDMPFVKMFDGSTPPFIAPLAQHSSGGVYSYIPIPYAKHCRVTVDHPGGLYYQVNSVTYPANTAVQPFALPLTGSENDALSAAADAWQSPATDLAGSGYKTGYFDVPVSANHTEDLAEIDGSRVVRELRLRVDANDADLRKLVLRAYFDNHAMPDVEAPVADFFGDGFGRRPFHSLFLTQHADGTLQCDFPMPFASSARFTLENGSGKNVDASFVVITQSKKFSANDEGYFHASWNQEITRVNYPHVWAHITGQRGHFVGIVMTMKSRGHYLSFLEGDDQVRVDQQKWLPCKAVGTVIGPWNGTGTEDCFNSGWYFLDGPIALPVNGGLVKDNDAGTIDVYRWYLNDAPVFQSSLDAQIEHGTYTNDTPGVYYSSVAYWYSTGQTPPVSPMPMASDIRKPAPTPPPHFANAIEGESLVPGAVATSGKAHVDGMEFFGNSWSGGAQLGWTAKKAGDTLTLTLPPHPGQREVIVYLSKSSGGGQVSFTINSRPIGGVVDLYTPIWIVPTGPISLGKVTLPDGPIQLGVTADGKDAKSNGLGLGLDAIVLK